MEVRWFDSRGVRVCGVAELPGLVARDDGWLWLDVVCPDDDVEGVLRDRLGIHPRAVEDCRVRNHVPKTHAYGEYVLLVTHGAERGEGGHVHYLELDQLVSRRFLVTVHGPVNPSVPRDVCLRESREVAGRIAAGRFHPGSPYALSYAITTAVVRNQETYVGRLAHEVGRLEQHVTGGQGTDPQDFLEQLYRTRQQLVAVRTMAAQAEEVIGRLARLARIDSTEDRGRVDDLVDQYTRLHHVADGQLAFLHGVTEFYRARTDTKMAVAAERLAVIAALTLPVTAVSSVMGMNVIVNGATRWGELTVLLSAMAVMSLWLLRWARRQGWW